MKPSDDTIPTRQTLLNRLKDWKDQDSWQEFYDVYWRLIFNVARRAGLTHAEAQDVVQETVVSVAKKIADYKAHPMFGSFKSWLLLITRRRIADQFRKRPKNIKPPSPPSADNTSQTPTTERAADPASLDWEATWNEQWQKNRFEVAKERVKQRASPKDYVLFYQQVVKEWPAGKVARQYHVSRAAAYMAKHRISKLIKREVDKLRKQEEERGRSE